MTGTNQRLDPTLTASFRNHMSRVAYPASARPMRERPRRTRGTRPRRHRCDPPPAAPERRVVSGEQRCSPDISTRRLHSYGINDWTVISRALVDEVTIVSASHRPVEPCAEVVLYRQAKEPDAVPRASKVFGPQKRPGGSAQGVRWGRDPPTRGRPHHRSA